MKPIKQIEHSPSPQVYVWRQDGEQRGFLTFSVSVTQAGLFLKMITLAHRYILDLPLRAFSRYSSLIFLFDLPLRVSILTVPSPTTFPHHLQPRFLSTNLTFFTLSEYKCPSSLSLTYLASLPTSSTPYTSDRTGQA